MAKIYIPTSYGGITEAKLNSNGELLIKDHHNVDAILKQNAYERNNKNSGYLGKGTETSMKKIGSISPITMMNLVEQGIFWDDKALLKWFDDLDNYLWRTTDKTRKGGK